MDMEQILNMQLTGGALFAPIDLPALLSFLTFSVVYLLVPFLGYQAERRGAIAVALYLLIAYMGLSLIQFLMYASSLFQVQLGRGNNGMDLSSVMLFIFIFLKMLVFLLAMLAFVTGLRSLRPQPAQREDQFSGEEGK
jgi:hypothetical protein